MTDGASTTRRRALGAVASLGALAIPGCLALGGTEDRRRPSTTTVDRGPGELSFGTDFTENGVRARPSNPTVQGSVRYETAESSFDVYAAGDRQYLFVTLLTGASPGIDLPRPDDFEVVLGDRTVPGRTSLGDVPTERIRPDDRTTPYDASIEREVESVEGWVAFPLPADGSFEEAALVLQPTEAGRPLAAWPLPGRVRSRLSSPPPVPELEVLSVPDRASGEAAIPVSIRVTNGGERQGRFRFGLNVAGTGVHAGVLMVPTGESRTWERTVDLPDDRTGGSVTVTLRTATGRRERSVAIGSTTADTGTDHGTTTADTGADDGTTTADTGADDGTTTADTGTDDGTTDG